MMSKEIYHIKANFMKFYFELLDDNSSDVEYKLNNFLFSEIINDLNEKGIKNFSDWLKYYSTNNFNEIVELVNSYYDKAISHNYDTITIDEKILIHTSVALYSKEMDIERPIGSEIINTIILTFIEVIRHYKLVLSGYLLVKGNILISDRSKASFYSVWETTSFKKELPITLFS